MTGNLVDLDLERAQRKMLAERAAEGGEAFVAGLQLAGRTLADLAWLLAAPVRRFDKELTHGIYQLVLQRLGRIVDDAIAEGEWFSWGVAATMNQGKDVAFAAFTARMLALVETASDQGGSATSDKAGVWPEM